MINAMAVIVPMIIYKIPEGSLNKRTFTYPKTAANVIKIEKKMKMSMQ